ncbi:MAG: tetratricopeptide repeat protein [Bacteroidota bacterium]
MMLDEDDILLINGKVEGSLSEAEEKLFDERYQSDNAFKEEVIARTQVIAGVEALRKQALKEEFSSWLDKGEDEITLDPEEERNSSPQIRWYFAVAAAIVPLLLVVFLWSREDTSTSQELFTANFTPMENVLGARSGNSNSPAKDGNPLYDAKAYQLAISEGMKAYDAGDYASAIASLRAIEIQDEMIALYLGISYLATGDTRQARNVLETKVKPSNKVLHDAATWYVALSYLKEKDYEKAQASLDRLIDSKSSDYTKDALKLKQKIDKLK